MNHFTQEQKKIFFEIHHRIKYDKNLAFINDFVRLYNLEYPDHTVSLKQLKNCVDELKVKLQ